MKGSERGAQGEARLGAQVEGPEDVGARVALGELREYGVGERLHGRRREDPAERRELGHQRRVADQVLHLGGEVEGEVRQAGVERPRHPQGVAGAVQEVGVAEGDVGRAGPGLPNHVLDHHLDRHGEEAAAVEGGDGAVAAAVQAAARGLGVAGQRARRRPCRRGGHSGRGAGGPSGSGRESRASSCARPHHPAARSATGPSPAPGLAPARRGPPRTRRRARPTAPAPTRRAAFRGA